MAALRIGQVRGGRQQVVADLVGGAGDQRAPGLGQFDPHRAPVVGVLDPFDQVPPRRFLALSDPTRLRILETLHSRGEASVRELTESLGASQQNVSKHLATLHAEGFVSRRKDGTSSIYAISDPTVLEICEQVCGGIEAQLDAVGIALRA